MDRRVALELLALEPDAPLTHDRLRRAYLRRLRVFSPERDPDGFQRLREAYEWLEQQAQMAWFTTFLEECVAEAEKEAREAAVGGAAQDESSSGESARDKSSSGEVARDESSSIASSSGASSPVHAAPVDATSIDAAPVDLPSDIPSDTPADIPSDTPADTPPDSSASPDPTTLSAVTDEILSLLQRGDIDVALDLRDRWNRSAIDDHRQVSGYTARRWALTRELLEIAPALSTMLCTAFARGIATGDLSSAHDAIHIFAVRNPERASDLTKHLTKRAPNLHHAFHKPLARAAQRVADRRDGPSGWSVVLIILVLVNVVRLAVTCNDRASQPDDTQEAPSELLRRPTRHAPDVDPATEPNDSLIRLDQIERIRKRLEERRLLRPDGSASTP